MERIDLVNVCFGPKTDFFDFRIGNYSFKSKHFKVELEPTSDPESVRRRVQNIFRETLQNAYVESNSFSEPSILVDPTILTTDDWAKRSSNQLDDILILASLLTGNNWSVDDLSLAPPYPVKRANWLFVHKLVTDENQFVNDINLILQNVSSPAWINKYQSSHHIQHFLNIMNVNDNKIRFASCVTLWELIYSKEFGREENNLPLVMYSLLDRFWPTLLNRKIFSQDYKNIYYFLRNQIIHMGYLPIDRPLAEPWMKSVPFRASRGVSPDTLRRYFLFFESLTYCLVFKTLDLNIDERIDNGLAKKTLTHFLGTGRVQFYTR